MRGNAVMSQTLTGIVIGGEIQLDQPISLPDQTPVSVTVQPLPHAKASAIAAWESLQARLAARPIHGGGKRYTRDELHERR
jgi:hypothetical protein